MMVEEGVDKAGKAAHGATQQLEKLTCPTCGLDEGKKLQFCSVCRGVAYCSRKCQLDDWKSHKPICKKSSSDGKRKGKAEENQAPQSVLEMSATRSPDTRHGDVDDILLPSIINQLSQLSLYDCACCGWNKDHALEFCTCRKVNYCSEVCKNKDRKTHQPICDLLKKMNDALRAEAAAAPLRRVYIPEKARNKCSHCQSRRGSDQDPCKLCPCFQMWYCSKACQEESWKIHKATCGKTDSPDIQTFYPLLAYLVERSHFNQLKPLHRAFTHTILNPGRLEYLGLGSDSVPVFLAPSMRRHRPGDMEWWPDASDDTVRARLADRILREGFVLPIITSVLVALLSEMYTTTSAADSDAHRVRLRYRSEPITDFGICAGSARVTVQDRLQYMDHHGATTHGQNPQDHYWMYFLTARGEGILLDCAMFTFNMAMMVYVTPYIPTAHTKTSVSPIVHAFFQDRSIRNNTPSLYTERTRMSVLHDPQLQKVAENSARGFTVNDEGRMMAFMEKLARRRMTQIERELTIGLLNEHMLTLRQVLQDEEYKDFPSEVLDIFLEGKPGEFDDFEARCNAWWDSLPKGKRKNKKRGNAWPAPPL